jgi:methionyl-tRNA synthetase
MIISKYNARSLSAAFGIEMSAIEGLDGTLWGRVAPGGRSQAHQHDETEAFVVVQGTGDIIVDGKRHAAQRGTVAVFEPFETHVIENTGTDDLVFFDLYWRDAARAAHAAAASGRRRLRHRPVFVFSTPPTPNGDLHLGHLSGPYLGADVYVRFQRMNGMRAWHLTGSDDFQSYVVGCARREGRSEAETAAHYSAEIKATLELMDIHVDQYTVTNADDGYQDGLRAFFSRLVASGAVRPRAGAALFDGKHGQYLHEVDVKGACPTCGARTGGNICEECGEPNVCVDLGEPQSALSDAPPRPGTIERFLLPLREFRGVVAEHHRIGKVPARLRELADRVFARETLDLAITHPASWGVRPDEATAGQQVIWVWPEMAYGFLHGIAALGRRLGESWAADVPQQDWKIVHFFGYDNSFYHAILYPVLYRHAYPHWAPDIDYNVNEFYLLEGSKFSTSRRHAIWGKDVLSPATVDAVRYYLARTRPEGRRTNFDRRAYETEVEEVLIGKWQAWLQDLGRQVQSRYGGRAPDAGVWVPEHWAFLARLGTRLRAIAGYLDADDMSLNGAAAELDGLVDDVLRFSRAQSYLADLTPFKDVARTAVALELAAARLLSRIAAPVMPRFAAKLADALGDPEPTTWPAEATLLPPGQRIDLAERAFFHVREPAPATADRSLLPWLTTVLRDSLKLPDESDLAGSSLAQLGLGSLQAITLQYRLLEEFGIDITLEDLLEERKLASLGQLLAERLSQPIEAKRELEEVAAS